MVTCVRVYGGSQVRSIGKLDGKVVAMFVGPTVQASVKLCVTCVGTYVVRTQHLHVGYFRKNDVWYDEEGL